MSFKYNDLGDRIIANSVLDPNTDCWVWIGSRKRAASSFYGKINIWCKEKCKTITRSAHRVSYEFFKGVKLPPEIEVDHVCENTLCVNPDHLEAVTGDENKRRYYERRQNEYDSG